MYKDLYNQEYDYVIFGTSLTESTLSAYLSKLGKKIMQIDVAKVYGGDCKNFNLKDMEKCHIWLAMNPRFRIRGEDRNFQKIKAARCSQRAARRLTEVCTICTHLLLIIIYAEPHVASNVRYISSSLRTNSPAPPSSPSAQKAD